MRRFAWLLIALAQPALADEAVVATAANFRPALDHLVEVFERTSAHRITISSGSTGTLYAQIVNGAPFDVFLAADTESPAGLIDAGLAIGESRFTYATGALALFTADRNRLRPSFWPARS